VEESVWTTVYALVAGIGVLIALRRRSRAWVTAGIAFGLGGLGLAAYEIILPYPPVGTAMDVAVWAEVLGGLSLFVGMVATLVALGRGGRRKFLALFAGVMLVVSTYQYWTTNWPARYGDVYSHCVFERGQDGGGSIQRVPPGLHCRGDGGEVFVAADAISWLALAGWSTYFSFIATFPVMGIGWLFTRRRTPMPAGASG
jgi:hypothetical protein